MRYLPAHLHNRPERIVPGGRGGARRGRRRAAGVRRLRRLRHRRRPRRHARPPSRRRPAARRPLLRGLRRLALFAALHDAEPGTFFLTDFLARHFDALVWQGLGLDRHPELRDMYFANYRRVVLLSSRVDPTSSPPAAPRPSGSGSSSSTVTSAAAGLPHAVAASRACLMPRRGGSEVVVILWRDIPAQVNAQVGRERHQVLLSDEVPAGRSTGPSARRRSTPPRRTSPSGGARAARSTATSPAAAQAEADRLEAEYSAERLGELAFAGGWERRRRARRRIRRHPWRLKTLENVDPGGFVTETVVSSATREVVIGFDRPFVMIGERINPTGRKLLAEEMKAGDFSRVEADAVAQVAAGAHMLDVNAGIPLADEPALLARAVQLVQAVTDVPLSIDSSIVEALEAGLAVYQGKPLVNSVTGEDEVMERVLPLVARHGAAVVAISNDETGISEDIDVRFAVATQIVERAADHGIPATDVVVDPLVMPIGALGQAGQQAFSLIRRLREELKVNTTCGASNISFGLPNRHVVTGTFLAMAIGAGMTSAIMSPLHAEVKSAVMAADVLAGIDRDCMAWIRANRDPNAPAGARGGARAAPPTATRDAPRRVHAVRAGGQGGRRHDRARGRPPARRRPRHRVRRPRHLRALPGHAERRALRQVGDRRRA